MRKRGIYVRIRGSQLPPRGIWWGSGPLLPDRRASDLRASTFLEGMPAGMFDLRTLPVGRVLASSPLGISELFLGQMDRPYPFSGFVISVIDNNVFLNKWLNESCPVSWNVVDRNDFLTNDNLAA